MAIANDEFQEAIDFFNKLSKGAKQISDDIQSKRFIKKLSEYTFSDYDVIYNTCIDEYYNAYEPDYYKPDRKFGLRDMFSFEVDEEDNEFYLNSGPDMPGFDGLEKKHRVDNQYIYDKMWMEGWHGGATYSEKLDYFKRPYPSGYEMAYRKPVKDIPRMRKNKKPGKPIRKYSLWSYREVAKTESVESMVNEQMGKYDNGEANYSNHTADERFEDFCFTYDLFKDFI